MEVIVLPTPEAIASAVADEFEGQLTRRPASVLGLATGSSPGLVYDELIRRHTAGGMSFARAEVFLLDEYVGLPPKHPERYLNVIRRELTGRLDILEDHVHGPDGSAEDLDDACRRYEAAIASAGGIDLQILGIGSDGHIAFNEPSSSLRSRTRVKTLTDQTRRDNARFFEDDPEAVPRHCLTQGLATILESRRIVLVATGKAKAEAVHHMVEGAVSALWPATVLQFHPNVTVYLDGPAASRLQLAGYYREIAAHKPAAFAGATSQPSGAGLR